MNTNYLRLIPFHTRKQPLHTRLFTDEIQKRLITPLVVPSVLCLAHRWPTRMHSFAKPEAMVFIVIIVWFVHPGTSVDFSPFGESVVTEVCPV